MDPVTLLCSVIVIGLGFDSFHFSEGTYLQFDFKRVKGSQLYRTSLSSLISHDVNGMEFVEYSVIHSKTLGDKRTRVEIRCYCLFQKCDRYWNCYRGWNNGTKSGNQTSIGVAHRRIRSIAGNTQSPKGFLRRHNCKHILLSSSKDDPSDGIPDEVSWSASFFLPTPTNRLYLEVGELFWTEINGRRWHRPFYVRFKVRAIRDASYGRFKRRFHLQSKSPGKMIPPHGWPDKMVADKMVQF